MIALPRRKFLIAAAGLIAAPAIVRVGSIMPVKPIRWATGGVIGLDPALMGDLTVFGLHLIGSGVALMHGVEANPTNAARVRNAVDAIIAGASA